jgi:hypothetical protein
MLFALAFLLLFFLIGFTALILAHVACGAWRIGKFIVHF